MGDTHRQPTHDNVAKASYTSMEFFRMAIMVRIVLMYNLNINTFFERPDENLKILLQEMAEGSLGRNDLS